MYQTLEYTATSSTNKNGLKPPPTPSLHLIFEESVSPKLLRNDDAGDPSSADFLGVDPGLY